MTPTPQEIVTAQNESSKTSYEPIHERSGERIVISGMSGLYPQSQNIQDLSDILYNQVNPITHDALRFKFNHPEVVQVAGTVPDLETFDAQFFKVHYRLGASMDPMGRKVLEQAYQAIYDAGVSPEQLNGKKVGVYVGTCLSETEKSGFYDAASRTGFGMAGCSKTMFANRVSYWLNARGPSLAMDQACCSSTAALEQAYLAINSGECESAIVAGAYLCLHPQSFIHSGRIMELCKDGKTKSFDEKADGCSKSEAINVLFLQKAKNALRIYAEVLHTKTEFISLVEDETGPKYGFYRNITNTTNFLKKFYEEAQVDPQVVEYVEAFGCAIPETDKNELEIIENVFCKDKDEPLLVGSVMSNIGYNEAATGISAVTKVLLGFHTGELAANLHCSQPRQDVCALREGRMRIVTQHQRFRRTYAAVNGMSFTGVNSHVLLHGQYKPKDINRYHSDLPRLVAVSGRHEESVKYILDQLKAHPIDPEQLALLHNIHHTKISGHLGRGYAILQTDNTQKTVSISEKVDYFDDSKRPLWFVYSGMGSQWAGMGTALLRIPIFAAAIKKCQAVLKPRGLDIVNIITTKDPKIFDNILHSFVGIAAVQIGLTDVLHAVGLKPDGIIGHSVGELGCGYADGCLSAEEMILAAYSRGLVSLETSLDRGSMAAVGLGYDDVSKLCPPEIDVACHNGPDSATISGPAEAMKNFVAELTSKGIFAKEVPCSNIAYHSRYIAKAGPALLKYLNDVIKSPKPRSKRWLSTSVPESKWDDSVAQFCSPEYQTNNLLSPVLFDETSRHVPNNAVLIEVAPHGLLQAILKRSMPSDCRNIPMTKRNHEDNALLVLESIGKLFIEGFNPKIDRLYPKIDFPVSTGTPFLSNLVQWAHTENWGLAYYCLDSKIMAPTCSYILSLHDAEYAYIRGNSIRGNILYPFTASLMLVWDTFAMIMGVPKKQVSVKFNGLQLYSQPLLHDRRRIKLTVTIQRGTGMFEVLNENSKVMTGHIYIIYTGDKSTHIFSKLPNSKMDLNSQDIYDMLRERDYNYSDDFCSIDRSNASLTCCDLFWRDNWATFIDGMLQLNALRQSHTGVSVPSYIRSIRIDIDEHHKAIRDSENLKMTATIEEQLEYTRCGGVIIDNIEYEHLPKKQDNLQIQNLQNKSENLKLECAQVGNYDSLTWVAAPQVPKTSNGVPVKVHYAGIGLEDIKKASGLLLYRKNQNSYAMDFSGISERGTRVMGLVPSGAASKKINAVPELLWPVPEHWSLEEAATVPLAYSLAFYCLSIKGKLMPKHKVYIHGGCGALGQAVISIALAMDCEVFTSVSDIRKKRFLCRLFPELKEENIGSSRDPNFEDLILNATKGKGCNIVISTAKEDVKTNASKASADYGIVFDLTQLQDRSIYSLGMNILTRERNYATVDLHSIFTKENNVDAKKLQLLMCEGISRGYVRPLSRVTYAAGEAPRAFKLLAASQHRGRVLLRLDESLTSAEPRTSLATAKTPAAQNGFVQPFIKLAGKVILINNIIQNSQLTVMFHDDKLIIIDINIPKGTNQDTTLKELGVSIDRIPLLSYFLKTEYNVVYDTEQILSLTMSSLLELEKELVEFPYEDKKGWSTFFNYVDSDELLATTDMVCLPSLDNCVTQNIEFDSSKTYLCIVPGMEGHFGKFETLCERLKMPALVLQPGLDHKHETIRETAERMIQVLSKKTDLNKDFYLLGYETGILVALEMASILEERGLTGTVYCLGYSPDELKEVLEEFISGFENQAQLQDSLLLHMYSLIAGGDTAELEAILKDVNEWSLKLDSYLRYMLGCVSHSTQYVRALIDCALARVNQLRGYGADAPRRPLRSQLVLLRAASARKDSARALQQHSLRPLAVHQLSAPLANATADLRCSNIINSYLDPKLLQEFENKNLCDTYSLSSNGFLIECNSNPE